MRVAVNDTELEVLDTGGDGPVVAFCHGLLWSHRMFLPQIEALRGRYRCIAWDHRGQGRSAVPPGRVVSIEQVTEDAIALLQRLDVGPVHFVGLSMGGFVGMRIAARRPELVRSLSLLATAADPEPRENLPKYRLLNGVARVFGVNRLLAGQVMKIMCAPGFLADPAQAARRAALAAQLMENGRTITKAVNGVLERDGVEHELAAIRCPTAVVWGTEDKAIARTRARAAAERIPGARWMEIRGAGHTSTLETPEAVTAALTEFLREVG